jgi:hypothetical protein
MATISGHLCDACWVEPWGAKGWNSFWTSLSDTGEGVWNVITSVPDRKTRTISYSVRAERFFEQAESCVWCSLLDRRTGLSRDANRERFTKFVWRLSFPTADKVIPASCTKIEVAYFGSLEHQEEEEGVGFAFRSPFDLNVFCMKAPEAADTSTAPRPAQWSGFFSPSLTIHGNSGFNQSLASQFLSICTRRGDSATAKRTEILPRRVLDIADPDRPRLREADAGETGEYACLSYRWGSHRTQSDFAQLARRSLNGTAEPSDFPKGFLEAAAVANGLGISNLWIDALCIMQDEPEDLIAELSKMDLYYANASVTIQCCGPNDVDEGFLGPQRLHTLASLITIMVDTEGQLKLDLGSRMDVEDVGYLLVLPFWLQGVDRPSDMLLLPFDHDDQPLCKWYTQSEEATGKRAWVLQEDLLSGHLMRFPSGGGLIMQCKHKNVECHDGNVMYDPMHRQGMRRFHDQKSIRPLCEIPSATVLTDEEISREGVLDPPAHLRSQLLKVQKYVESGGVAALHVFLNDTGYTSSLQTKNYDKSQAVTNPNTWVYCVERVRSDTLPTLFRRRTEQTGDDYFVLELPLDYISAAQLNGRWLATVDNYCERQLANPGDKLTAIGAVAKTYSDRYYSWLGEYCAGLWSNFIAESLLWKVEVLMTNAQRTPGVPSFSWGAVQGALYADLDLREDKVIEFREPDVDVLASKATPLSSALPFGSVEKASIHLRGLVVDAHWEEFEASVSTAACEWHVDGVDDEEVSLAYPDHPDFIPDTNEPALFLLIQRSVPFEARRFGTVIHGLLLKQHEGIPSQWCRVGYARRFLHDWDSEWQARFRRTELTLV